MSALGESLQAGKNDANGKERNAGGNAASSSRPFSGRGGSAGRGAGRRGAEGADASVQFNKKSEAAAGASVAAGASSGAAPASSETAGRGSGEGRGGNRGGRGRGGNGGRAGGAGAGQSGAAAGAQTAATGAPGAGNAGSFRGGTPPAVPGMMTPFIPAAGRGAQGGVFYSGMYPGGNVYYPPSAYGMPALQPSAAANKKQVMDSVRKQIEYYFSVENLCKDIFLRSKVSHGNAVGEPVLTLWASGQSQSLEVCMGAYTLQVC